MIGFTAPGVRRVLLAAATRLAIALGLVASLVVGVGLVALLERPFPSPQAGPPPEQPVEPAPVPPGTTAPVQQAALTPQVRPGADPVREWADQVSGIVDVPARALVSYANAELAMRTYQPSCRISWATLAGIGRIESDHGRYAGRFLQENGRPSSPIIGVPLDGAPGVQALPPTTIGLALDGDPRHDHAVGPMQIIPTTWAKWATTARRDGAADPQNLDDASMTAARYLCASGRDMTTGPGWWSAVLSYNSSVEYAQKVFALAQTYANASDRVLQHQTQ